MNLHLLIDFADIDRVKKGTFILTLFLILNACSGKVSLISKKEAESSEATFHIPFASGTESNYTLSDINEIEFTANGVARLKSSDQTDDDNSTDGFGAATQFGTQWDSINNLLRLNTTTNNAELDSSWAPQWNHLQAYWKLNETSGTTIIDSGPNGYNGTISGAYTLNTPGKLNGSILMNVNDKISMSDTLDLAGNVPFTISAWMKSSASTDFFNFIGKRTHPGTDWNGWIFYLNSTSGQINFERDNVSQNFVSSNGIYNDGNWHYVVTTYDGTTQKIYVDGKLDSSLVMATVIPDTVAVLEIGNSTVSGNYTDEIAVWDTALTATEIAQIYSRQKAIYSGLIQSRVLDAKASLQNWTTFAAKTTLPFGKELLSNSNTESSTDYSSITGDLMTGLVGLWHLDESSGTSGANSVLDSSGSSAHGTPTNVSFGNEGILGTAASFNGTSSEVLISSLVHPANVSVSSWFYLNALPANGSNAAIWGSYVAGTSNNPALSLTIYGNGTSISTISGRTDASPAWPSYEVSGCSIKAKKWYHAVFEVNSNDLKIYVNGSLCASNTLSSISYAGYTSDLYIGQTGYNWSRQWFNGAIDEVAMWNRSLSSSEVLQLYRRGANRIKYQMRSCANVDCSDQDAIVIGKGWKGPDNTSGTYFSEIDNLNPSALNLSFLNFTSSGFSLSSNRYFQYRSILESDDENNLCDYSSGATSCSPEIKSISVGPNHYTTTPQSILSSASIGEVLNKISSFSVTLGSNSCSAGARFTISKDGVSFYYWNGSTWALSADTYDSASNEGDINTNISTLPSLMGSGNLQLKLFLKSDGSSPCEIDDILISGQR